MRRASFEGASKSLQTPFGANAFRRKRREARACDIHIASLIESSDIFFGIFAKAVQIMASQSPSFSVA
jgi:hypothetical protein